MSTRPRSSARIPAIGCCVVVVALAACGGGGLAPADPVTSTSTPPPPPPTPRVVSVNVSPAVDTIKIGDTLSVSAQVAVENGAAATVSWLTSDPALATVTPNASGSATVIGVARGAVTVTARSTADTTKAGQARITVVSLPPAISGPLRMTPASLDIVAGQTARLTPSVTTANAAVRVSYAYTSLNPRVATVDTGGTVTAVAQGATSISVTANGAGAGTTAATLPASVSVRVTAAPAYALALTPATLAVTAGQSATADVSLTGLDGGFIGPVTLSVTGAPAGVTVSAAPAGAQLSSGGSVRLTIAAAATTAAGSYPLTVRGTAAPLADRTATLALTVAAPLPPRAITPTLVAGYEFTCQLRPTGRAACWGRNDVGQLGDGTTTTQLRPVAVTGDATLATLAGSGTSSLAAMMCGFTTTGQVLCWGRNPSVPYADGAALFRTAPTPLAGALPPFAALSPGANSMCGLTDAGQALCWGSNFNGQLGDGTTIARSAPVPVAGGQSFTALSRGGNSACALTAAGRAFCWGDNTFGVLGDGTTLTHLAPAPVSGDQTFAALAVAGQSACGLTSGGQTYCWGRNDVGQLGDGTTTSRSVPTPLAIQLSFVSLAVGWDHACGLTSAGRAYCWGPNFEGALGDGTAVTMRTVPTLVFSTQTFTALAAGYRHTCGLTSAGQVLCWGNNSSGQLGDGTTINKRVPTPVLAAPTAMRIP